MSKIKVALYQLTSELDYKPNLEKINRAAKEAKEQGALYLFLPECFYSMSDGSAPTPHLVKDGNEHYQNIQKIAKDHELFLVGGSVAYDLDGVVVNRAINFSPDGRALDEYDKMHLFSCDIVKGDKRKKIDEGDIYTPGKTPKLVRAGELNIGMGICFDLRYPKMAREYVEQGANCLTFASAFTVPTGKAHWHTLVRARAIENQCFVVAAAQYGRHNDKIQTFGHSLIVDPWGEILQDAGEGEKLLIQELDLSRIEEVRSAVKVF